MPSWNAGRLIVEAAESVLSGLDKDDELVVQDGLSDDGSINALLDIGDPRIKIESRADAGQADALQRALERATGEWVGWVNADDVVSGDGLRTIRQFALQSRPDVSVVFGDYSLVDLEGKVLQVLRPGPLAISQLLWGGRRPFNGSMLIRRERLHTVGGFDASYKYCMDYELYLRLWRDEGLTQYLPVAVGALRIHDGTKTTENPWAFVEEAHRARLAHSGRGRLAPPIWWARAHHFLTVATTGVRGTRIYRRIRDRRSR